MKLIHHISVVLCTYLMCARADYLGPRYPPPTDLTGNSSLVAAAWRNLSSALQAQIDGNQTTAYHVTNYTFSASLFSAHDEDASESLQFHHTAKEIATAPNGTNKVDGNSIYRIASVTKVFTVLTALLGLDETDWNQPLTNVIPGLAEFVQQASRDSPSMTTKWNEVTVRALAAQIGGTPRDGAPYTNELLITEFGAALVENSTSASNPTSFGFPPLDPRNTSVLPRCYQQYPQPCLGDTYVEGIQSRPPAFLPWTTPAYSNSGFILLGLALSNITGKTLSKLYNETIFDPIGMTSSFSTAPEDRNLVGRAVIAGDPAAWATPGEIATSSGGLFSSINDLAKFGIAILNSTLLPTVQTRKWMKPVSHTANLKYAVGAPWEIVRFKLPSGAITDMYAKSGDSGFYNGYIVLLPDYDAGFSILAGSTSGLRSRALNLVADLVAEHMAPALEAQAAAEAQRNFAGTYQSAVSGLNSSLTLALNESVESLPGLAVTSWISNGTDFLPIAASYLGSGPPRLVPSIPELGSRQLAFRLVAQARNTSTFSGEHLRPFSGLFYGNGDWISADSIIYGGIGLSLFLFDVDAHGSAQTISPAALRATLNRSI